MTKRAALLIFKLLALVSLFVIAAYYTNTSTIAYDLSSEKKHSLSAETQDIIGRLTNHVEIHAFLTNGNMARKRAISDILNPYLALSDKITLSYLDPDTDLDWVQKYGNLHTNQLLIQKDAQVEITASLSEPDIASALLRLIRAETYYIATLSGHGEKSLFDTEPMGYSSLYSTAQQHGFNLLEINLAQIKQIPDNAHALLITQPKNEFLPGEVSAIRDYVNNGGNLIWLLDPEQSHGGLGALADDLSMETYPGLIVDTKTQLLGLTDPAFALITDYLSHPITNSLKNGTTLFPHAAGIEIQSNDWDATALLTTDENTWTETSTLEGEITFTPEDDEQEGPITLGYTLTKPKSVDQQTEQRLVVIGDSDFISNGYINSGANQQLVLNLFSWVTDSDSLMNMTLPQANDMRLQLSMTYQIALFLFFLVLIPTGFTVIGLVRWLKVRSAKH